MEDKNGSDIETVTAVTSEETAVGNGGGDSNGGVTALEGRINGVEEGDSTKSVTKRGRGRPKGSGKLQILASLGGIALDTAGSKFKPYAMTIERGEDITQNVLLFCKRGARYICILSATGAVSSVDIWDPRSQGGVSRYEGYFEILNLSGSHALNKKTDTKHKFNLLTVSLANADGQIFGGPVAGSMIAAVPIQLIIATFKQDLKKRLKVSGSVELSVSKNMLCDSDGLAVQPTNDKRTDTEEDFQKPASFPFPDPHSEEVENVNGGQIENQTSVPSFDGNALHPLDHISITNTSDTNSGIPKT